LCSRYASHSTKYLNHQCDILMEDANDPHTTCQRTSASTISNHVASNNWKDLQHQGYHFLNNATNGLDFGTNKHGINAAPWERSFTNYRRAGLLLPLMSSTRLFLPKSPRNFLMSLSDRFLVCYLIRVTVTIPKSSFQGHFPLFCNCRGTRPWVCFYCLLLAFT
jgi:hypothetical protein